MYRNLKHLLAAAFLGLVVLAGSILPAQGQERPTDRVNTITKVQAPAPQAQSVSIASLKAPYPLAKGQARWAKLSVAEQNHFMTFYNQARSETEKYDLMRALGSGHSLKDIEDFARMIRGKDDAWLRNALHLVNSTAGYGIVQQWSTACGPATVQAVLGEIDPIYSLLTKSENPNFFVVDDHDAMRLNPKLASIQKEWLESVSPWGPGGVAVNRKSQGGKGRVIPDLLNKYSAKTGLDYGFKFVKGDYTAAKALADLDLILGKSIPVPLHVSATSGNKHFVLAVGLYYENNQKWYLVHDPWTGKTVSRSPSSFLENRLQLAGNDLFTGVVMPTIKSI